MISELHFWPQYVANLNPVRQHLFDHLLLDASRVESHIHIGILGDIVDQPLVNIRFEIGVVNPARSYTLIAIVCIIIGIEVARNCSRDNPSTTDRFVGDCITGSDLCNEEILLV